MADFDSNSYRYGAGGSGAPANDYDDQLDSYEMRRSMDRDRLKKLAIGAGVGGALALGAAHLLRGNSNANAYQQLVAQAQQVGRAAQKTRSAARSTNRLWSTTLNRYVPGSGKLAKQIRKQQALDREISNLTYQYGKATDAARKADIMRQINDKNTEIARILRDIRRLGGGH